MAALTRLRSVATVLVAVVVIGSWWVLSTSGIGIQDLPVGRSATGESISVTVDLPTADGITIGADVRNGQKVIGRVRDMSMSASGASVVLSLDADAALPANTEATVELPSALGNPFVRLSAPATASSGALRDGDVIPPTRAVLGPQIESALATFGALLSRSGVDQFQTIITELDTAFAGRSGKVRALVTSMATLMNKAAVYQDDFDVALAAAADVSDQLVAQSDTVSNYLSSVSEVVAMLDGQRHKLETLFASTTALAATANNVLGEVDLTAMVSDAARVVATLSTFNDRVGTLLTTMNTFLERFGGSVQGDYLIFDGALDIPGTIDKLLTGGVIVNGTPINGQQALEAILSGGLH